MIFFEDTNFTKLYYKMLSEAYYSTKPIVPSRVGDVKDLGACTYQISEDTFRLCFLKERAINPFFALAEFSWIINGSNKLKPLQYFISNYDSFSDDKVTLNGAYGHRLRKYFKLDQINEAIKRLQSNPDTRRVVLSMWSTNDLTANSKDIPCNTTIYLKIRNNKLDISITNRSNDLYLGVPYNIFVFYLLQVYIANQLSIDIGIQTHFTDSLHLYERDFKKVQTILENNSLDTIDKIIKSIPNLDISNYLSCNHQAISNTDFSQINNSYYENIFQIYSQIKKNTAFNKALIPNDILGLVIKNWLLIKKSRDLNTNLPIAVLDSSYYKLQVIKHCSAKEIQQYIEYLSHTYINHIQNFVLIINKETKNSLFSIKTNKELDYKLLKAIFLSIVLDSLSSNLYNKSLREEYMDKIRLISKNLNLSIDDIFKFSYFVDEWKNIISKKEHP
jgi:thymidylate synthase